MGRYYVIHDFDPELKRRFGSKCVPKNELALWNRKGFGVFFTPNDFIGARRAENLLRINFWIADIDEGTKAEQMDRINNLPMPPSVVVETKKGFHCYWRAADATPQNYESIEKGIFKRLHADTACKDVCRTLRLPGFYHLKDPKNPFLVRFVWNTPQVYTERQMLFVYGDKDKKEPVNRYHSFTTGPTDFENPDNWERLFHVSQILPGGRNNDFARIIMWLRDSGLDYSKTWDIIRDVNSRTVQPLEERELENIVRYQFKK